MTDWWDSPVRLVTNPVMSSTWEREFTTINRAVLPLKINGHSEELSEHSISRTRWVGLLGVLLLCEDHFGISSQCVKLVWPLISMGMMIASQNKQPRGKTQNWDKTHMQNSPRSLWPMLFCGHHWSLKGWWNLWVVQGFLMTFLFTFNLKLYFKTNWTWFFLNQIFIRKYNLNNETIVSKTGQSFGFRLDRRFSPSSRIQQFVQEETICPRTESGQIICPQTNSLSATCMRKVESR